MQSPDTVLQQRLAVSPAEAARLAGIGRTRLYQSLSNGELRSFKIGTRRLIRITDLDRWLSTFEVKETPDAA